jgi:hypothetical protein
LARGMIMRVIPLRMRCRDPAQQTSHLPIFGRQNKYNL